MINKKHYTVLTYIIGDYEIIHPIKEKSSRARYILITDNPTLTDSSKSWEIIYDDKLTGSNLDKCYQIRFNPFKYTSDSIIIRVDSSIGIERNLDPLIDKFIESGCDRSLMIHPYRNTMVDEYAAWTQLRGYPVREANRILNFLREIEGYDVVEYKGLVQFTYEIITNNRINNDINRMVYSFLKYLGDDESQIHRVDQTIFSAVIQKYFPHLNILWVDQRLFNGNWMIWYQHHSDIKIYQYASIQYMIKPYWLNEKIDDVLNLDEL